MSECLDKRPPYISIVQSTQCRTQKKETLTKGLRHFRVSLKLNGFVELARTFILNLIDGRPQIDAKLHSIFRSVSAIGAAYVTSR